MNAYQRFSSSLALNVHFHALLLDGVYTTSSPTSPPIFRPAPRLTQSEVETVQRDVTRRIASVLRAFHIHAGPDCDPSPIPGSEDSGLPFLRAASIQSRLALGPESGQPIARVIDPPNKGDNRADKPSAPALTCTREGYSLHAATLIRKGDHALREGTSRQSQPRSASSPSSDRSARAFARWERSEPKERGPQPSGRRSSLVW